MCNDIGRRIFHKDYYLKFDKFHYKNRVPFAMYYDLECIIKDSNKSNNNKKPYSYCLWIIFIK